MPLLKILLAEDEREARELLLHYLKEYGTEFAILECADGISTQLALEQFQPDILFLDVKMPELSGIEVLQQKSASYLPAVIFTTAYDEYALPAFDFEAVDYLLKPFDMARFKKALQRAIKYVDLVRNKQVRTYIVNLPVKSGSRTELVSVSDILYIKAEGAYVQVVTGSRNYLVAEAVYELESLLNPEQFFRVHRSVIVNKNCIKSIQSLLNGDHLLMLINGREIRASRTYLGNIKKLKEL